MLYFINYKEQKIHKQVNGFFGIDINDKAAAAADDDESDTNKDEKPNKYK
jgi:hypothetical protein